MRITKINSIDVNKKYRLHKNLFLGIFIFLIGQQTYFPMEYKYFHLALCFVFILITDIYHIDYRDYSREIKFMIVIIMLGIVPIVDSYMSMDLAVIYYVLLLIGCYFTIELIWNTYKMFKEKNAERKFSSSNKSVYNKNSKFIEIYLGAITIIILIAMSYAIFDLLKSII